MEQHIHIHIGDDSTDSRKEQIGETSTNKVGAWYDKLLHRVRQCYDWKSLYELREDFNSIGLAVKETGGHRNVLCRLENGRPIIDKIIDDYIFVGCRSTMDEEIGERALEVILHFIQENANRPQTLVNDDQQYSRDTALYGYPIRTEKPQSNSPKFSQEAQQIEMMSRLIDSSPSSYGYL